MSNNFKTDVFLGTTYGYDFSVDFSTKPASFTSEENMFEKQKENCVNNNCSWIDDHGFI
jgi:hypothetical protein